MNLHQDTCRVLFDQETIAKRVAELGRQITRDYQGKNLLMICTPRGASVFFCDLIRQIDLPLKIDFIATSSYGCSTTTSGEVRMIKDTSESVKGKDVVIVEDIIDSGLTLSFLKKMFEAREAASVKVCTMLDKPEGRKVDFKGDYVGFEVPNAFVVGYGLDYAEKYRNLPDVCVLDPKIYS